MCWGPDRIVSYPNAGPWTGARMVISKLSRSFEHYSRMELYFLLASPDAQSVWELLTWVGLGLPVRGLHITHPFLVPIRTLESVNSISSAVRLGYD